MTCDHGHEHDAQERHIGKSSFGWCFSLHVYPEEGIDSLSDWIRLFAHEGSIVFDEYGREIDAHEMMKVITERKHPKGQPLLRHTDRHCVAQGEGTWDCIVGEFS